MRLSRFGRPPDGDQADRLNQAGPANDATDGRGADPPDPAGSQSQCGCLENEVFARDAQIESGIIDAGNEGGETVGNGCPGDPQGDENRCHANPRSLHAGQQTLVAQAEPLRFIGNDRESPRLFITG
jgi:hypothetical protein